MSDSEIHQHTQIRGARVDLTACLAGSRPKPGVGKGTAADVTGASAEDGIEHVNGIERGVATARRAHPERPKDSTRWRATTG